MPPLRVSLVAAVLLVGAQFGTGQEPKRFVLGTTVTGRVLSEPGGKPVAGVLVTLWNGSGGERRTARTDEKGAYSFADVKSGDSYKVWIEERPAREAGIWSEDVAVKVEHTPVRADDLFAALPQSLSGTVTDAETGKPVAGADINFSTVDNRHSVKTDANGRYRLFVAPRDVDLHCSGTDDRYEPAERPQQAAVGEGKHVEGIDFKVKSAPPFTVLVVNPDGKPAKGADVLVEMRWPSPREGGFGGLGSTGRDRRFTTDADGRFIGYLRGSRGTTNVELKVIARPLDHSTGGVVRGKTTAKDDYRIDTLKIVLARSAGFLVRVIDPDGQPILKGEVMASHYRGWDIGLGGPLKNLGDGKYLMTGLIPGLEYHLTVNAPGFRAGTQEKELILKPDEIREIADIRLDWWGKKAVPGLVKKLQSADAYDREFAASLLGELGADAAAAMPALVEKLKNDKANTVRFGVAAALGKIGPPAKAAVPDLIKALQEDMGGGVQREAATALGLIGDLSALPSLKVAATHVDTDIQRAAAEALKRLDEVAKRMPQTP